LNLDSSDFGHSAGGATSTGDAAAPSVATITVAHYAPDSLVNAVTEPIAPSSSGASSSAPQNSTLVYTTTITGGDTPVQPVPIPPACFLFGSGLAFLAPLRFRHRVAA